MALSVRPLLRGALEAAVSVDGAIAGGLQVLEPDGLHLRIVESIELPPPFLEKVGFIDFTFPTTCAQCCLERRRVIVRDLEGDPRSESLLPLFRAAGFRAMQSGPLLDSHRQLRGAMSTQFAGLHHPSLESQRDLDLCCRIAAMALEARAAGAEADGALSPAARYAVEAAISLVGTVQPGNRAMVLEAVIANLDVVLSELPPPAPAVTRHTA